MLVFIIPGHASEFLFLFLWNFSPFFQKYIGKGMFCNNFHVYKKKSKKLRFLFLGSSKIFTIAYTMNECLRFYTFIFWYCQIWLNILMDDCPLQQHHKIENKNIGPYAMIWEFLGSNIRISLEITFLSLQSRGDNCTKEI